MLSFGAILSFSFLTFLFINTSVGAYPLIGIDDKPLAPSSRTTNAMRLARGLPPLPPTKRHSPHAHLARRSAIPGTEVKGSISLKRSSDNYVLGYSGPQANYLYQTTTTGISFGYKEPAVTGDFVQIYALSNSATVWAPAISTPSSSSAVSTANMGPGQTTVLSMSWWPGVSTAVGATPVTSAGWRVETTIYSIASDGRITPTWVNWNGNRVTVFPCVNGGSWYLVGSTADCTAKGWVPANLYYQ